MISTSNKLPHSPPPKLIIPIILDNIKTKLNIVELTKELTDTFNTLNINITTKTLNRGGIVITPEHQNDINTLLDTKHYNTDKFGTDLYIHLAGETENLRPWLCINKAPLNLELKDIKNKIEISSDTNIEALHRKVKGPFNTTLILFKTKNINTDNKLLNTVIHFNDTNKGTIRKYINTGQTRCTQCQQIGHLKKTCKNPAACVLCGGNTCPSGHCKNDTRKCVNCEQDHAASYKNCPAIKQHAKDNFKIKRQLNVESNQNNLINTQTKINLELNNQHQTNTTITQQIDTLNDRLKTLVDNFNQQIKEFKTQLSTQAQINIENNTTIDNQNKYIKELQTQLGTQTQINIDLNNTTSNNTNQIKELETQQNLHIENTDINIDKIEKVINTIKSELGKRINENVEQINLQDDNVYTLNSDINDLSLIHI